MNQTYSRPSFLNDPDKTLNVESAIARGMIAIP